MTEREQKIQAEMRRCVHFNGVFINESCKAEINYHDLMGREVGCFKAIPCLKDRNSTVECPKREFPTREQAEKEVADTEATMERFVAANHAVQAHAIRSGFGRGNPGRGELKCPNCEDGKILYAVASNGHKRAACSTEKCVSWME